MKKYNQHYVPRSVLRNFADSGSVFFLLKDGKGEIRKSAVENLCAEKDFYCFSLEISNRDTRKNHIDYDRKLFDKVDGMIAPILRGIVSQGSINHLTEHEKKSLAKYVVYQYMRSPAAKDIATSLSNEKTARQLQGWSLLDEEFIERVSNMLCNHKLKLLRAESSSPYIISDSPVLWSSTGEGIYFPISPDCCVCYQKKDVDVLDSICVNEIEFLASVRFNISRSKETLKGIWQESHRQHIKSYCESGSFSYWKCILSCRDSSHCIKEFVNSFLEEIRTLLS